MEVSVAVDSGTEIAEGWAVGARIGDQPDAEFLARLKNSAGLRPAPEQRVFALHRGDGLDGMGAATVRRPRLRQTEMPDLALLDQLLGRTCHVLDRHVGIDAVLIEEVDNVDLQPLLGAGGARGAVLLPSS